MSTTGPTITVTANIPTATTVASGSGPQYDSLGWPDDLGRSGDTRGADQQFYEALMAHQTGRQAAKQTPCVTKAPAAAPLNDINEHAKYLESTLSALNPVNEYGAIIWWKEGYGTGNTPLFTSNNPNGVVISYDAVPTGATIVAVIHNHRNRNVPEDQLPSPGDRVAYDGVLHDGHASAPRYNFYTDPNLLMYIFDQRTGKAFVYDRDTVKIDRVTCDI